MGFIRRLRFGDVFVNPNICESPFVRTMVRIMSQQNVSMQAPLPDGYRVRLTLLMRIQREMERKVEQVEDNSQQHHARQAFSQEKPVSTHTM
jgi:membrane carboxypeptidase/penicillin-binding protein